MIKDAISRIRQQRSDAAHELNAIGQRLEHIKPLLAQFTRQQAEAVEKKHTDSARDIGEQIEILIKEKDELYARYRILEKTIKELEDARAELQRSTSGT